MTYNEIKDAYWEKRNEIKDECSRNLENLLKDNGFLDTRVIRKRDGREGELRVDSNDLEIKFYYVTKKGEISRVPSYVSKNEELHKQFEIKEKEGK